ncbi:MAG: BTAD domain-containing putative transcriptional regulator [Anaerolineae bacterium]|nr:BTAD domain-containing putative transcriptional regulator [Anaerolineae bacterium]MDT8305398.1 BTAD domain-containing putative transcriptional regulator [Anaerolineae bacterium]
MTHLSLTFLGCFHAARGERALTAFRSTRVQGLLVYLALRQQEPQARDVLATLFWPDEPDAVAKKNLRQSLYQLRQVLGEEEAEGAPHLLVTRTTMQFNAASDHSLDVTTFLTSLKTGRLEQAVTAYGGELLPGFTCDSLPFEAWLREERERLHRLALDALSTLAEQRLAQADYRRAEEMAQRQLALEPWREEAYRQLMQALALRGERSAALVQYEACRSALADELGVEPGPETKALAARIRSHAVRGKAQTTTTWPVLRRLSTPFVGRQREHGALVDAYRQAQSRGARVVAVLGEAGIGKTRLVEHFLSWATSQGADLLHGRAFESSGRLSYHPLTQALRQRLERENAPEDLLSDLWLTQLTRILPELRDRYPDLREPTQEEATARQHLFEAITRLGLALAERAPLVLFLDDWHWADVASLDVLHYALLRWSEERAPILVLLTLRQETVVEDAGVRAWLSRLKHGAAGLELDLEALSAAETEELIRTLVGVEGNGQAPEGNGESSRLTRFSRWLFEETDGQPFFVVETLKALADDGFVHPDKHAATWHLDWQRLDQQSLLTESRVLPGIQEIIRGWLERISGPAARLLAAAAVLGQDASFDRLGRVAGLQEMEALIALDELLARQLLLESNEASGVSGRDPAYRFSHQKLGEVVYAQAGAARRRILHRRAFAALQTTGGPAAELAHHAYRAGLTTEAIRYSIVAGNEAMRLLAVGVAVAHYETAWQFVSQGGWPQPISADERRELYTNLGRAYELTAAWSRAQEVYEAFIAYSRVMGASALECLSLNRLATVAINGLKEPEKALALLEQAQKVAEESGDRRGLAETEWNLSIAARIAQATYRARHHGERALALARTVGDPQLLARCLNSLAYVHAHLRQWETMKANAREAQALYAAAGNRVLEADCQRIVGWSQMYSGHPQESLATLRATMAFSQEIENLWGEAECGYRLAHTLLELGEYGEAMRLARKAVSLARRVGQPTMGILAHSTLGTVQRTGLALAPARETLLVVLEEYTGTVLEDWALAELCAVHAIDGEWERACDYALEVLASREDQSLLPMSFCGWYETEALLRGGKGDLARAEAGRLTKIIGDNRRFRLPWHRSQAVLAEWDGNLEKSRQHLQAALALAQEMELPGEQWPVLGALAVLYAERGEQAKAEEARQSAAGIIRRLAESIDEGEWRAQFLAAKPIQQLLEGPAREKNDDGRRRRSAPKGVPRRSGIDL